MIKPLKDNYVLKPVIVKRSSSLLLTHEPEKTYYKVIACGEDAIVKVDDIVLITKFAGRPIEHNGQEYLVVGKEHLLAVFMDGDFE